MAFNRYVLIEQLKGVNKRCTVSEFAQAIGYTERHVSRWMSGRSKPPPDVVERMAELFGLPVEAFTASGELTPDEYDLVNAYRQLDRADRARVIVYIDDLAKDTDSQQLYDKVKKIAERPAGRRRRTEDAG